MNANKQKLQMETNSPTLDILIDVIEYKISMLTPLLSAIKKWKGIVWDEFSIFEKEQRETYPKGFEYVDPIAEEAFVISQTSTTLYGGLSVNIAALVEDLLKDICDLKQIEICKDKKDRIVNKPLFSDYLWSLGFNEHHRKSIKHYSNHCFVRELANRFKHDGGKTTKTFIDKYGQSFELTQIDEDIEYDKLPWDKFIKEAEEFLLDIVNKGVTDSKVKELAKARRIREINEN